MRIRKIVFGVVALGSLVAVGCGTATTEAGSAPGSGGGAAPPFLLATEPAGARGVIDVRAAVKDGDEVVLVGRIGGEDNPWVDGKAAFRIVDAKFKPCNERPGDNCEKPWDYCCDDPDELHKGMALVKIVDASGRTLDGDAKKTFGFRELQTVVVKGKAKPDDKGNLTVLATGVFVRS